MAENPIYTTIPCSVGILTFNSATTLRRTLQSVRDFDDIIICDGGSTDETLAIAHEFGARIVAQDPKYKNPDGTLKDYSGVRNQLLDAAKHDWFLYIDSDETISEGLHQDIERIVNEPLKPESPLAYRVPIGIMIDNRYIKYSSNYPGYQYRFFHKRCGGRFSRPVHERIFFDEQRIYVGTLAHPWYIHTRKSDWTVFGAERKRYRKFEIQKACREPFSMYVHSTILWHLRICAVITIKSLRNYLLHGFRDSMPVRAEMGRALNPLILIARVTACRIGHLTER